MAAPLHCSMCSQQPSAMCICVFPPLLLCSVCKALHESGNEAIHIFQPISLVSASAQTHAKDHYVRICAAETWLQSRLSEVQQCDQAIRQAYEAAAERLKSYTEERLRALSNLSTALLELINYTKGEVTEHLLDSEYVPGNYISRVMWNFSNNTHPRTMEIFHWKVAITDQEILQVSFWTPCRELTQFHRKRKLDAESESGSQEIGSNLVPIAVNPLPDASKVVYVTPTFLRFFDCSTEQWEAKVGLDAVVQADETSSYGVLETGEVLLTGGGIGGQAWDSVYLLKQTGEVKRLSPMDKPRRRHALVVYGDWVYVFGGWSQTREKSTEKMHVQGMEYGDWRPMDDMLSERSSFNPCCSASLLYLCGGSGSSTAEVFSPLEELFSSLPFELPDSTETFSTLHADTLHIISKEFICQYPLHRQLTPYVNDRTQIWGSMTPIKRGSTVYFPFIIDVRGDVKVFHLENYEWEAVPNPD